MRTIANESVCFLGTGLIGASLAIAAKHRGQSVRVWNRTKDKANSLRDEGIVVCSTIQEAVAVSTRIHIAVTADAAVDSILSEIIAVPKDTLREKTMIIDHSTTSPEGAEMRAELCKGHGIIFFHAPIFMSPAACRSGGGHMVVSGPQQHFDTIEPTLQSMTGAVRYAGEDMKAAATYKLAGNCLILSVITGIRDAYAIARGQGMPLQTCQQFLQSFALDYIAGSRGARMAKQDFTPSWSLRMARKDMSLMAQSCESDDALFNQSVGVIMDGLIESGLGDLDVGVLAKIPQTTVGNTLR